jgi:uncharacterized membrane protein YeaQ/YmgE (transglycosylase-associated protein family)
MALPLPTSPGDANQEATMNILAFIVIGLVAGLIARALVPGTRPMGLIRCTLLGMAGSLVAGSFHSLLFGNGQFLVLRPSGLIASVIGAIVVFLLFGASRAQRV